MSGHYGDIYCCRWFPSVKVVLSCGADLRIKIWSTDTGECAGTLVGHTKAVTDLAIIDRGRNIISVSKYLKILKLNKKISFIINFFYYYSLEMEHLSYGMLEVEK
jgi:WD40 repeat protein